MVSAFYALRLKAYFRWFGLGRIHHEAFPIAVNKARFGIACFWRQLGIVQEQLVWPHSLMASINDVAELAFLEFLQMFWCFVHDDSCDLLVWYLAASAGFIGINPSRQSFR